MAGSPLSWGAMCRGGGILAEGGLFNLHTHSHYHFTSPLLLQPLQVTTELYSCVHLKHLWWPDAYEQRGAAPAPPPPHCRDGQDWGQLHSDTTQEHLCWLWFTPVPSASPDRQHFAALWPFKDAVLLSRCSSCLNPIGQVCSLCGQASTSQQILSPLMKQEGTSQQKHIFWKEWDKWQSLTPTIQIQTTLYLIVWTK